MLSLFAGVPADLQFVLRGLDAVRTDLVSGLVADYVAGRFDFTDEETVRQYFEFAE